MKYSGEHGVQATYLPIRTRCTVRLAPRAPSPTSKARKRDRSGRRRRRSIQLHSIPELLGLPPENVRVIFVRGSGCYGLNGADTVSNDAALLSQAVGSRCACSLPARTKLCRKTTGSACVIEQRPASSRTVGSSTWDCENVGSDTAVAVLATTARAT